MRYYNIPELTRNFCIAFVGAFCLAISSLHAAQYNFTSPVNSSGNNFTMLSATGGIVGGTNDVVFTWDGTLNDAVPGAVSNATLSSDEAFFSNIWEAHDVTFYGPGTYTVYDGCTAGDANCGIGNAISFTVGASQIGSHILFDWPKGSPPGPNGNIDVVLVWNFVSDWASENPTNPFWDGLDNGTGCTSPLGGPPCVTDGLPNTRATTFSLVSTDVNSDGIAGTPMTDGAFTGSIANFNLSGVVFPNNPPVALDYNTSTATDTATVIDLATRAIDTDGTIDATSVAIVPGTGPSNGILVNNGDGTVTYTPNGGFVSPPSDGFQYTIDDNLGDTSNSATVTITVLAAANTPSVANDVKFTTNEDVPLNIAITDMDDNGIPVSTDADGDPLTFEHILATDTKGSITVDATDTQLTYTPPQDFSGVDFFNFVTNDGPDDSNIATVTVTVIPVNDPPVCTDVSLATDIGTPLNIVIVDDLLSTCSDIEGDPITLDSTTQPMQPGSQLVDNGNGTLTYTPAANYQGQDSFTYTATDGTDTDTRTVTIDVGKIFGNFTMLDAGGSTFGGTNDVVASWDRTLNTAVTDTNFNMTMGSFSNFKFFGFPWSAHDIRVFGPGTYSFDTSCTAAQLQAGMADCGGAPNKFLNLTVGQGQVGGHMLFDWNVTQNIDVVLLWDFNGIYTNPDPAGALYLGSAGPTPATTCVYQLVSRDADGDGVPGAKMIDGPFIDFRANFNVNFTTGCQGGTAGSQKSSVDNPSTGCTISNVVIEPLKRSDLLLLMLFTAWLGCMWWRKQMRH